MTKNQLYQSNCSGYLPSTFKGPHVKSNASLGALVASSGFFCDQTYITMCYVLIYTLELQICVGIMN